MVQDNNLYNHARACPPAGHIRADMCSTYCGVCCTYWLFLFRVDCRRCRRTRYRRTEVEACHVQGEACVCTEASRKLTANLATETAVQPECTTATTTSASSTTVSETSTTINPRSCFANAFSQLACDDGAVLIYPLPTTRACKAAACRSDDCCMPGIAVVAVAADAVAASALAAAAAAAAAEAALARQSTLQHGNYFSCNLYGVEVGKQVSAEVRATKRSAYDFSRRIRQSLRYVTPAMPGTMSVELDKHRFTLIRADGGVGLESGGTYYIRGYNERVTPWEKRVFLSTRTKNYRDTVWAERPGRRDTKWTLSWDIAGGQASTTVANDKNVNIKAAEGNKGWLLNTNRIYAWNKGVSHSARTFDDDDDNGKNRLNGAFDDDDGTPWFREDHNEQRALFPSWARSLTPRHTDNERNTIRHYPDSPNWNLRDCRALGTADVTSKGWHELLNVPDNVARAAGVRCSWEAGDDELQPTYWGSVEWHRTSPEYDNDDDDSSKLKCKHRRVTEMKWLGWIGSVVGGLLLLLLLACLGVCCYGTIATMIENLDCSKAPCTPKPSIPRASVVKVAPIPASQWACTQCSRINPGHALACSMCSHLRTYVTSF